MGRDNTPKPVKTMPSRAQMKKKKIPLIQLIEVPRPAEQGILDKAIKYLPFLILQRGKSALEGMVKLPLPSPLPFIFKWTAWAIGKAAKRFSVDQK